MAACSQLSTQSADFKLLARFQSGGHINHMDHRKNAKGLLHQVEPRWWGSLHCSWHPGFAGFPGFATRISIEVSSSDDPLPHVGAFSEPLAPLAALAALTALAALAALGPLPVMGLESSEPSKNLMTSHQSSFSTVWFTNLKDPWSSMMRCLMATASSSTDASALCASTRHCLASSCRVSMPSSSRSSCGKIAVVGMVCLHATKTSKIHQIRVV